MNTTRWPGAAPGLDERRRFVGIVSMHVSASASTRDAAVERPLVPRPVDADVLHPRLDAERVQQAVIVVRRAVALVDGDVELVRAFDQIERLE